MSLRPLSLLALLLLVPLVACTPSRPRGDDDTADDDDSATADDDDTTGDDDTTDDDDTADDDDTTGDDDDSTSSSEPFIDVSYCLDWNTMTFTSPANFVSTLDSANASLNDSPLLMNPTSVNIPAAEIFMLMTVAEGLNCLQDTSYTPYDLTADQPGSFQSPHFSVGPQTIDLGNFVLHETQFEGDFSSDGTQITAGSLTARLEVTDYSMLLCSSGSWGTGFGSWNCSACPTSGVCVDLVGSGAVWTDNGQGPLTLAP